MQFTVDKLLGLILRCSFYRVNFYFILTLNLDL